MHRHGVGLVCGEISEVFTAFFIYWGCFTIKTANGKDHLINDEIDLAPSKNVRVIGDDGEQFGIITLSQAQSIAYDRGLDLVLMSAQADPPVCKVMDYGKFRFEREKKEKEARKKQKIIEVKEIQLTCLIAANDFNTKVTHARRFLTDGDKVKVMVKFKGRQMSRQEVGKDLLDRFKDACADLGTPEKAPVLDGRNMIMFIAPAKNAAAK
jgi:translation initiation factor IF-3